MTRSSNEKKLKVILYASRVSLWNFETFFIKMLYKSYKNVLKKL